MSFLRTVCIATLLLFSFTVISAQNTTLGNFNPNVMCSLLPNGTKIKDPRACNVWIECIDSKPAVNGTCAEGLFYDRSNGTCVPQSSIKCISSDPCAATTGTNGFVGDPYSCNAYYYCNYGNASRGVCPTDWNFNPSNQDCERDFPCVAKMDPDNYCNIVPDGVFIKNPSNCNGYQLCWKGVVVNSSCPDTFYYDALTGECDYPDQVDCVEPTSAPLDVPAGVCAHIGDFISDNRTCNGYYYCRASSSNGSVYELQHGTCASGRFFDPANGGACVPRTQIVCNYDRCVGLGSVRIQLASETEDDCRGFAICQKGKKIGAGNCPDGEYFDELTQLCTTEVITFPACAGSSTETTTDDSSSTSETTATP